MRQIKKLCRHLFFYSAHQSPHPSSKFRSHDGNIFSWKWEGRLATNRLTYAWAGITILLESPWNANVGGEWTLRTQGFQTSVDRRATGNESQLQSLVERKVPEVPWRDALTVADRLCMCYRERNWRLSYEPGKPPVSSFSLHWKISHAGFVRESAASLSPQNGKTVE